MGNPQAARQLLQRHFPQTAAAAVAATPVGHDQQLPGMRIMLGAHLVPPTADGLQGKPGGIVIHADTHPPLILTPIGHAVGNGLAQRLIHEIMHLDLFGLSPRSPLLAAVTEQADQFLLPGIHRDHRLTALLKTLHRHVDVLELSVAVRIRGAFLGLAVTLQAIPGGLQKTANRPRADGMRLAGQLPGQLGRALACPAQRRARVSSIHRLHQSLQCLPHPGSDSVSALRPPPGRRTRVLTTAFGFFLRNTVSAIPLRMVLRDIPVALLTALTPPRP